jgi:hypothetical protein
MVAATIPSPQDRVEVEGTQVLSIPELPFPGELESLAHTSIVRDLFAPPASALAPKSEEESADKSGSITRLREGTGDVSGAVRLRQRRLSAVFITEGLKIAVVDTEQMGIGQVLDDCTLAAVSGNQAKFECPDESVVLYILDPKTALQD